MHDLGVARFTEYAGEPLQFFPHGLGDLGVQHRPERGESAAQPPDGDPHLVDRVGDVAPDERVEAPDLAHLTDESRLHDLGGRGLAPRRPGVVRDRVLVRHVSVLLPDA